MRPDWNGQGLTDQSTDALGNVATFDRDANGLATVAIDRLNRIDQYTYDTKGNITDAHLPRPEHRPVHLQQLLRGHSAHRREQSYTTRIHTTATAT